jgi:D-3-phosphoglycerate dehydrogenase
MKSVFLDYATVACGGDLEPRTLQDALPGLELHDHTPDELVEQRIAGCSVVLLNKARITRERIERNPRLELVALTATGTNNVDLDAARERGVAVCNIRDYCTASVVQHVWAVLLALTHRLREYDRALKAGAWERAGQFTMLDHPIRELTGRTLGVVGYGTLGRGVAAVAAAFGMRVLVANRPGGAREPGRVDLPALPSREAFFQASDVLTLHLRLNDATRGIVTAAALSRMKPTALLVNTSRAELLAENALVTALNRGRPGMAAVDVFETEPILQGHPLLRLENAVCTPHIGYVEQESYERVFGDAFDNVVNFIEGRPSGLVNPEALKVHR